MYARRPTAPLKQGVDKPRRPKQSELRLNREGIPTGGACYHGHFAFFTSAHQSNGSSRLHDEIDQPSACTTSSMFCHDSCVQRHLQPLSNALPSLELHVHRVSYLQSSHSSILGLLRSDIWEMTIDANICITCSTFRRCCIG